MVRILPRSDRHSRPAVDQLKLWEQRYAGGEERPLGSYAILLAGFGTMTAGLVAAGRARGVRRLPERIPVSDLVLLGVATFRAARLLSKDSVTAVARAPFTRFEEPAGAGEVNEEVVGRGFRHAVGELVSCPFCISVWLATLGTFGLLVFPRPTRTASAVLCISAASDTLQFVHSWLQSQAE